MCVQVKSSVKIFNRGGQIQSTDYKSSKEYYEQYYFILIILIFSSVVLIENVVSDSCDPMDCSPPGLSVHGICQARILE